MIVYSGTSSGRLGTKVAEKIDARLGETQIERFPDGEIYVRVLDDRAVTDGEDCVIIKSTPKNDDLVELIILLDLLRDLGVQNVHAVIPYMGYARQDKRFREGEAISAKTILKTVRHYADSVSTINAHFCDEAGVIDFHGVGLKNLDAFPLVASYYKNCLEDPIVIAPDKGSLSCAKKAAEIIGCDFDFLKKTRICGDKVEIETKELQVRGKDIIILDDMISTGGTIIEASKLLYKQGAKTVNVGCVHGVFSHGVDKVKLSIDNLICTDTLTQENEDICKVSVADLIASSIR